MAQDNKKLDPNAKLDKVNLAFGLLAILLLSASLAIGNVPAFRGVPDAVRQGLHYGGLGAMALYVLTLAVLNKAALLTFFKHRHTQSGAHIAFQVAAVIGILAALNYFGTRHHTRFDLTENKQYSLSEQSRKVVQGLKEPVKVTVFVKSGEPYSENLKNLWKEYQFAGSDKLNLEVVDIDRSPMKAREMKITAVGSSVLERGERKTTITGSQEQDLTSALIKVGQSGQKVVYFTTGHGELAIEKFEKDGLSSAKDALEKQNYKLDTLLLYNAKDIPSDAALIVLAGPTKPLMPAELQALERYIDKGGRVFLSLQPQSDAKLDALTKKYGIEIHDDLVIDPRVSVPASPVVQKFPFHTITQGLQAAFFTGTRSLGKLGKLPEGVNVTPIVESAPEAWGETDIMSQQLSFDPAHDRKGPLQIMMMGEKGKGRLIVAGNTLFLSNATFMELNNGDLFLNAVNFMADEANLIAIPPKDSRPKSVEMMPWQYTGVFYATVVFFPLTLLLAAGLIWWRRR